MIHEFTLLLDRERTDADAVVSPGFPNARPGRRPRRSLVTFPIRR
jgi:hypothetical protein